ASAAASVTSPAGPDGAAPAPRARSHPAHASPPPSPLTAESRMSPAGKGEILLSAGVWAWPGGGDACGGGGGGGGGGVAGWRGRVLRRLWGRGGVSGRVLRRLSWPGGVRDGCWWPCFLAAESRMSPAGAGRDPAVGG